MVILLQLREKATTNAEKNELAIARHSFFSAFVVVY